MFKKICCFAGSNFYGARGDVGDAVCVRLLVRLAVEIEEMYKKGVDTFITCMRSGPDLWFSEIVLNLRRAYPERRIKLITYLPYNGYVGRYSREDKLRYLTIIEDADQQISLHEQYENGCHQECCRHIICHAGHMLCLWNGRHDQTEYMIHCATKQLLDIVILDPLAIKNYAPFSLSIKNSLYASSLHHR